ncbi:MAG: alpha/beta hydrolase [Caldilineaceae bacterium]
MSFIKMGDSQMYYEMQGEGTPFLFLHDGLLDCTCWDSQFASFSKTYRTIRYDRQAYGRSGMPTLPFSILETAKTLLEHLHVEQTVLIGSSIGGTIALHFALAYPQMVKKLIIVGSHVSGMAWSEEFQQRMQQVFMPLQEEGNLAGKAERVAEDPYLIAPENTVAREWLRQKLLANPRCLLGHGQLMKNNLIRFAEFVAADRLHEILVPTLIIVGESDAPDIHTHTAAMQAGIPTAQRVVMQQAGHYPYIEKPEEFNRITLQFLHDK